MIASIQWCTVLVHAFLAVFGSAQFLVYSGSNKQLVFGQMGLNMAVLDSTVDYIVISGNITLNSGWSTPPPIVNRSLLLVGDENSTVVNTLNFGGLLAALVIGEEARVQFSNLTLMGAGPQNIQGATLNQVNYKTSGLGLWPSIVVLDGSTVLFNQTTLQYYSQQVWSRCANFAAKVKFQLAPYVTVVVSPKDNSTLYLPGNYSITANITDVNTNSTGVDTLVVQNLLQIKLSRVVVLDKIREEISDFSNIEIPMSLTLKLANAVGESTLFSNNCTMTCVIDPFPQDSSISGVPAPAPSQTLTKKEPSKFKWWYGLLAAVGAVILLGVALLAIWGPLRRRRQHRRESSLTDHSKDLKPNGGLDTLATLPSVSPIGSVKPEYMGFSTFQGPTHPSSDVEFRQPHILPGMPDPTARTGGSSQTDNSGISAEGLQLRSSAGHGTPLQNSNNSGTGGSPAPWSDVTALLRARSDYSDIEVGPLIGRGSYGRVYKGRWKGAFVAIKIVDHQEAATKIMALREGALSHSVQHPNVITTYTVFLQKTANAAVGTPEEWEGDRRPPEDAMEGVPERAEPSFTEETKEHFATCMVLEYADRGTLEKAVVSGKFRDPVAGIDLKWIHKTLLDIAGGMDYLHGVGVLHGDLKGANVLLKSTATDSRGFSCKLADFGMARVLAANSTHVSTQTYGTISYMPPELLRDGKLTRAVDSYSFAIIMWELFSGTILHSGLTMAQHRQLISSRHSHERADMGRALQVFYKVCYEENKPLVPEGTPTEYEQLMVRCWSSDPADRPTFSEISQYLQNLSPRSGGIQRMSHSTTVSRKGSSESLQTSLASAKEGPLTMSPRTSLSQAADKTSQKVAEAKQALPPSSATLIVPPPNPTCPVTTAALLLDPTAVATPAPPPPNPTTPSTDAEPANPFADTPQPETNRPVLNQPRASAFAQNST